MVWVLFIENVGIPNQSIEKKNWGKGACAPSYSTPLESTILLLDDGQRSINSSIPVIEDIEKYGYVKLNSSYLNYREIWKVTVS